MSVVVPGAPGRTWSRHSACPGVPFVPALAVLASIYLMLDLPATTWVRFLIWMAIGSVLYFAYGRSHSRLVTDPNYSREASAAAAAKQQSYVGLLGLGLGLQHRERRRGAPKLRHTCWNAHHVHRPFRGARQSPLSRAVGSASHSASTSRSVASGLASSGT